MTRRLQQNALALALGSTAMLLASCAGSSLEVAQDRSLALGLNSAGERCDANRTFDDDAIKGRLFDVSYAINCRNVAASRSLGFIRAIEDTAEAVAAVEATLKCGAPAQVSLEGVGPVEARRCFDSAVGAETVAISFERGDRRIIGSASPAVLGPMEEGLRLVVGTGKAGDPNRMAAASLDLASLPAAPGAQTAASGPGEFDAEVALQQGILLNHKGLHVEASRRLNDALSRLPADVSPVTRAGLLLEAGLADSNIKFADAAAEHFARADEIIAAGAGAGNPFLLRKRDTYKALDLLNRRRFRQSLIALEQLVSATPEEGQPLMDPALVRALNQPRQSSTDAANAVALPSKEPLLQLLVDAQANWARSAAMLNLGDIEGSERTLSAAERAFAPLKTDRIDQGSVLWLQARLLSQRGRIAARKRDWTTAVASYDQALDALTQSSIATDGTGSEPAIAEMKLERAAVLAAQGAPVEVVRAAYSEAVDLLTTSSNSAGMVPEGLERYLDLLIEDTRPQARADNQERFFLALQAVGEPAVARQLGKLQSVVTASPEVGAKVRARSDLERQITALRYQIGEAGVDGAALEGRRQKLEGQLLSLNTELAGNQRFSATNDTPATIAEVRAALQPGEGYLKISQLSRKTYGVYIDKDNTFIYALEAPSALVDQLAQRVRASIDGRLKVDRQLVAFDVAASYGLFNLLAGPAMSRILEARSIVVDPAGPLEALPAGVLVTDRTSLEWYNAARRSDAFDYSGVNFLAERAAISTAVSPRSFLVVRSLPPSRAPQPFIGFAEHAAPAAAEVGGQVNVGNACSASAALLRELASEGLRPISREEVRIAADALGVSNSPMVAGQQFTDTAVRARTDLDQYEVLHFATHGLSEGMWGCPTSPPALVTSFGDANSDGLLSFDEIAALQLDANLVVLSACETASGVKSQELARRSGQEEAGSTLEGLVRAFLTANSRAVLATHWEVSAESETDDLVRSFYSAARSNPIGSALQTAQRALSAQPEYSHPFYWGAYFVVGDSSKMMLRRGNIAQAASR
jgi:tetratricopeptide (TPR) repeat protein